MNCKNCKADCASRGYVCEKDCQGHIPKTNADRIRSMTDEELAEWLNDMQGYSFSCGLIEARISEYPNRHTAWLEWLKEEVKHDNQQI